jgi:hypothetical protein
MSGGGQMATATQQPSGPVYGGIPVGNAYAQPQQQMVQQGGFMNMPQRTNVDSMPFRNQSMDEGMVGPGYNQAQTQQFGALGIAGLQNNLPPALGMPSSNMGGMGGQGGGTDVIVHGMPLNAQQGMGGLQQMPMQQMDQLQQQTVQQRYAANPDSLK